MYCDVDQVTISVKYNDDVVVIALKEDEHHVKSELQLTMKNIEYVHEVVNELHWRISH